MKSYLFAFFSLLCAPSQVISHTLTPEDMEILGDKIWKNECAGTIEGLTHWNVGEDFASLGIGHFIWYPEGKKDRFHDTFPSLLKYLEQNGAEIPSWLKVAKGCPWYIRDEFTLNLQSPQMVELRQLLFDTKALQINFIADRLKSTFPSMIEVCNHIDKEKITLIFNKLTENVKGLYALIDYLNFKGAGTSPQEAYNGQAWGLLQVLQGIPTETEKPIEDFVTSAKTVLKQRVQNSPLERNEERWLKGWYNRLDTYLN